MKNKYSLGIYEKGSKAEIIKLIDSVWGKSIAHKSAACWVWKFDDNPHNPPQGPRIMLLRHLENVVGLMSTFSVSLKIGKEIHTALWTVDFMVHPDHRGRAPRVVRKLMKEQYILVGTPNEDSYRLSQKMGWRNCCDMITYINIVNIGNVLKNKLSFFPVANLASVVWKYIKRSIYLLSGFSGDSTLSLVEVSDFGDEMDKFWEEVAGDYQNIVIRNKKYLKWRFIDSPNKKYKIFLAKKNNKISGYMVFRCQKKDNLRYGYIVDFLTKANDEISLNFLLSNVVSRLISEKVDLITCLISQHNKVQQRMLFKNGFLFRKKCLTVISSATTFANYIPVALAENKWFITMGDSDLDM